MSNNNTTVNYLNYPIDYIYRRNRPTSPQLRRFIPNNPRNDIININRNMLVRSSQISRPRSPSPPRYTTSNLPPPRYTTSNLPPPYSPPPRYTRNNRNNRINLLRSIRNYIATNYDNNEIENVFILPLSSTQRNMSQRIRRIQPALSGGYDRVRKVESRKLGRGKKRQQKKEKEKQKKSTAKNTFTGKHIRHKQHLMELASKRSKRSNSSRKSNKKKQRK